MTLDTKALEAAAKAVDAGWDAPGPPFEQTEREYQQHCRDTARSAIEAYLSAASPPSRVELGDPVLSKAIGAFLRSLHEQMGDEWDSDEDEGETLIMAPSGRDYFALDYPLLAAIRSLKENGNG